MYEKKYREIIGEEHDNFVSINDIRLTSEHVKRAIKYLREIYRYRISKTRLISLNKTEKVSLNPQKVKTAATPEKAKAAEKPEKAVKVEKTEKAEKPKK